MNTNELLEKAKAEPVSNTARRANGTLVGNIETIRVLRQDKNMSWNDVVEWLAANGVKTSRNSLCSRVSVWRSQGLWED